MSEEIVFVEPFVPYDQINELLLYLAACTHPFRMQLGRENAFPRTTNHDMMLCPAPEDAFLWSMFCVSQELGLL